MEEYLDSPDIVLPGKPGHQEQIEEDGEKDSLRNDSYDLDCAVFLRSFFFQF